MLDTMTLTKVVGSLCVALLVFLRACWLICLLVCLRVLFD